jgi:diguanylate cyclase (GGDEF)-like protein/PAS domain S-box-containing protein
MRKPLFENKPRTELERAYFTLLSNLPGMVYRCKNDTNWTMLFLSEGCKDLTGYTSKELMGGDYNSLINPEDQARVWEAVQEAVEAGKQYQIEYRILDKQGKEKWVWERGIALPGRDGEIYLEGFIFDITEKKNLEEEVERMSFSDMVTHLPNKYYIFEVLQKMIASFGNGIKSIGVLVIDVNDFSKVNEKYGVKIADAFLKAIGEELKKDLGSELLLGRLQSDKFVVISNMDQEVAFVYEDIAKKIISKINKKYKINGAIVSCEARIGIAIYADHMEDAYGLIQKAEFTAKQADYGSIGIYDDLQHAYYLHNIAMEEDLRYAIEAGQINILYQPIVDITTEECVGIEALARWDHPKKGSVPPEDFIKLAEKSNLIFDLEDYILGKVFSDIVELDFSLPNDFRIAINISSSHIQKPRFRDIFSRKIEQYGVNPEHIAIELTETAIASLDKDNENIKYLKNIGCSIVIDDFGSGQSSLARLYLVPFDKLKIDKYFVENMDYPVYMNLVHSIVDIGKSLRMQAIAEGVETPKQRDFLLSIGCKYAQGFYFSKPLDIKQLIPYLRRANQQSA